MRYLLASLALSCLVTLAPMHNSVQQGMIPVIDTNPNGGTPACPTLLALPMNEASGTTFNDTSGNGHTVTVSHAGDITWTANVIKSGVTSPFFNSETSPYISDSTLNFTSADKFSISLWVNRGTSTTDDTYVGTLNTPTTFNGWEVGKAASGNRAIFFLVGTVGTNSLIVTSTNAVPASAITYLTFTYDGSLGTTASSVKIYINGSLETNVIIQNTMTTGGAGSNMYVGSRNNGTQPFVGPMGYVQIAGCVWSGAKVAANFAAGPGIY